MFGDRFAVLMPLVLLAGCGRAFTPLDNGAAPLSATANPPTVAPLGTATISVAGGSGHPAVRLDAKNQHSGPGAHVAPGPDARTFVYTAGAIGDVADALIVSDGPESQQLVINVSAALVATPGFVSIGPSQSFPLSVSGGSPDYCFRVERVSTSDCPAPPAGEACGAETTTCADGGGDCIDGDGVFHAGGCGPETDQVVVTDQVGGEARVTVQVSASLQVVPADFSLPSGGEQLLVPLGGVPPYQFALDHHGNISDGAVSSAGAYVAGPNAGVADLIEVRDAAGNVARAIAHVTYPSFLLDSNDAFQFLSGDFNGDSWPDSVLLGLGDVFPDTTGLNASPSILSGFEGSQGGARLTTQLLLDPVSENDRPRSAAVADFDGDGRSDVLLPFEEGQTTTLRVALGRADGSFMLLERSIVDFDGFLGGVAALSLGEGAPALAVVPDASLPSPPAPTVLRFFAVDAVAQTLADAGVMSLPFPAPARSMVLAGAAGSATLFEPAPDPATGCPSSSVAFVPVRVADDQGALLTATPDDGGAPFLLASASGAAVCVPGFWNSSVNPGTLAFFAQGVTDLNGDGQDDYWYAPSNPLGQSELVVALSQVGGGVSVLRHVLPASSWVTLGTDAVGMPEFDVTGQSLRYGAPPERVALDGDGGLSPRAAPLPASTTAIGLGDLDRDGYTDAMVVDVSGTATFLPGTISGDFGTGHVRRIFGVPAAALGVDIDRDGIDDVYTVSDSSTPATILWGTRFDGGALALAPQLDAGADLQYYVPVAGGAWTFNQEARGLSLNRVDLMVDGGLASSTPVPTPLTRDDTIDIDILRAGGSEDGGDVVLGLSNGTGREQVFVGVEGDAGPALADVTADLERESPGGPMAALAPGGLAPGPDGIWVIRHGSGADTLELHAWTDAGYAPASNVITLPFSANARSVYAYSMPRATGGPRDLLAATVEPFGNDFICSAGSATFYVIDPLATPPARLSTPLGCTPNGAFATLLGASDLDGDGRTDGIVFDGAGVFMVWQNPDGSFSADHRLYPATWAPLLYGIDPIVPAFGDFDADGRMDLFLSFPPSSYSTVLLNHGGRVFY